MAMLSQPSLESRLAAANVAPGASLLDAWRRLRGACDSVLARWTDVLRRESATKFPEGVTAFREGMSVHGRYAKPCPRCGETVLRVATRCPRCTSDGI